MLWVQTMQVRFLPLGEFANAKWFNSTDRTTGRVRTTPDDDLHE